jgi:hypothetical protein
VPHTHRVSKPFQLISGFRDGSTSKESPSRTAPKKKFPSLSKWRGSTWASKNEAFFTLATALGLEDLNPTSDWLELLSPVMKLAIEQNELPLLQWLEELEKDARVRCPRAQFIGKLKNDDLKCMYVDCKSRGCEYCHDRWVVETSSRWAKAFQVLGEHVYLVLCDDGEKASNVVDYATRLKHATLQIPGGEDQRRLVITTHPRKGSQSMFTADLENFLFELVSPLGKGDGRVTSNRYLREGADQAESEGDQRGKAHSEDDDYSPGVVIKPASRHWAVARGYTTYDGGHTWTITIPPEEMDKFWQINSGEPPEHRYRSAA